MKTSKYKNPEPEHVTYAMRVNYGVRMEPYIDGDPDGAGEAEFAHWCITNDLYFNEWVKSLVRDTMYKHGMYKVISKEQFEEAAKELFEAYNG